MKWIIFLVIFKLQHWFISLGGRRLGGCSLAEKEMPTEPFISHPGSTSLGLDWMCPIAPYKLIVSNWNRFWSSEWFHITGLCPCSFKTICMFVALNNSWCARGQKSSSHGELYSNIPSVTSLRSVFRTLHPSSLYEHLCGLTRANHWEITEETTCFKFTFGLMGILASVFV